MLWWKLKHSYGLASVMMPLGHDTGDPRVFFRQPVPVPVNTVPIWVRVRVPPRVGVGHHGFVGFAAGFCSILHFLYIIILTIIQNPSTHVWSEGGGSVA